MVGFEVAVLWRTFVSTLFATLLRNHRNYRDKIATVGSSASLLCDTIYITAVKTYKYWWEIALRPFSNRFLLYPPLTILLYLYCSPIFSVIVVTSTYRYKSAVPSKNAVSANIKQSMDTSIRHPFSDQSTIVVKGLQEFFKVFCMKPEIQILRFYLLEQKFTNLS